MQVQFSSVYDESHTFHREGDAFPLNESAEFDSPSSGDFGNDPSFGGFEGSPGDFGDSGDWGKAGDDEGAEEEDSSKNL